MEVLQPMYFSAKVETEVRTQLYIPPTLSSVVYKLPADIYKGRIMTDGKTVTSYIKG